MNTHPLPFEILKKIVQDIHTNVLQELSEVPPHADIPPHVVIVTVDGENAARGRRVQPSFLPPTVEDRRIIMFNLGIEVSMKFPNETLAAAVLVAPAWGAKRPIDSKDAALPPSQDPNRSEIILIDAVTPEHIGATIVQHIDRVDGKIVPAAVDAMESEEGMSDEKWDASTVALVVQGWTMGMMKNQFAANFGIDPAQKPWYLTPDYDSLSEKDIQEDPILAAFNAAAMQAFAKDMLEGARREAAQLPPGKRLPFYVCAVVSNEEGEMGFAILRSPVELNPKPDERAELLEQMGIGLAQSDAGDVLVAAALISGEWVEGNAQNLKLVEPSDLASEALVVEVLTYDKRWGTLVNPIDRLPDGTGILLPTSSENFPAEPLTDETQNDHALAPLMGGWTVTKIEMLSQKEAEEKASPEDLWDN